MKLFNTFYCITQHDDIVLQKGTSSSEGAFCYEAVSPIAKHKQRHPITRLLHILRVPHIMRLYREMRLFHIKVGFYNVGASLVSCIEDASHHMTKARDR